MNGHIIGAVPTLGVTPVVVATDDQLACELEQVFGPGNALALTLIVASTQHRALQNEIRRVLLQAGVKELRNAPEPPPEEKAE